jgi:uncharacterized Fe-S cluster-containing radical SAM superfamily protein
MSRVDQELLPTDRGFAQGLLMDLLRGLKRVPAGGLLGFSTSQDVAEDLERWGRLTGNAIVSHSQQGELTRWVVRHGAAPSQGEDRPIGARIWLYTNFHCNLACDYCCVRSSPTAARRQLGLERVERICREASALGVGEIFVTGGEPFLLPDIDRIVSACAATAPTVVLTNGMLFRGKQREKLATLPRDRVTFQVSLDSPTPELHDRHRGAGSWQKALDGIRIARDEGFRVRLAATVSTDQAEAGFRAFLDAEQVTPEDRVIRRIALRGAAEDGVALARADLWPEPTFTAEGVYWHPVAATDKDMFVGPELFPLAQVFERVRAMFEAERQVHSEAASVFRCA